MTTDYPYQNLLLKSIKGETWRPVPGFEGYYEISSHGRIKSLERERIGKQGGIAILPPRIMRQKCQATPNRSVGDNLYTLMVMLSKDGFKYSFSVGRLVYYAFVAPLDLKDRSTMISYKDGDGRNLHYKNLLASNIKTLRKQSYENGRYISSLRQPVSQFDTDGNLIAQYPSMYDAGRKNGFGERAVAHAANGRGILYMGFVWQPGYAKKLKKQNLPLKAAPAEPPVLHPRSTDSLEPAAYNLSLQNMPGERWKDFPGYEGLYKISNYGRIKALRKVSEGKQKKWYPECMKKLTEADRNKVPEGRKTTLIATLCKEHKKKTFHVARYVYHLFVKKFDLKDQKLRIYYKDGNPHNLNANNLHVKNAVWSITKTSKRETQV